jgi:DNA polymerase III epsilon subunit-like protein
MSLIVADVETTGLVPGKNVIVSIGAVDYDSGAEFYGECRIYPDSVVDQQALDVNGFTLEQITDPNKPLPHELYAQFDEWAQSVKKGDEKQLLGGQQIGSFDSQFLQVLCKNADLKWRFGHRSIDLHSVVYSIVRQSFTVDETLIQLGIGAEPKPHNGLTGARLETQAFRIVFNGIDRLFKNVDNGTEI